MPMVKISELNLDGKYQFMSDLPDEDYQALKEDIREWGVQNPPEIDENYRPLDGWNRIRACQELGKSEIPVVIRDTEMSEEQKIEHAIVLNIARRQVTNEQKKGIFYKVREEHPEYPLRRIAQILGVGKSTVNRWDNNWSGVPSGTPDQHEGLDGRNYPANEASAQKQREEIRETIEEHPDWSNRKVADEVGVSHNTVINQRKAMEKISENDSNYAPFDEDELASKSEDDKSEDYVSEPVRMETKAVNDNDIELKIEGPCPFDEFDDDEDTPEAIDSFTEGLSNLRQRFDIEIDMLFQEYDYSLDSSENINAVQSSLNEIQSMIDKYSTKVKSYKISYDK